MKSQITVLLDGDILPTEKLKMLLAGSYVIAADGGIRHAQALGLIPSLWVGDFDSASSSIIAKYADIERQTHPADKNQSDGELALSAAVKMNPEKIVICGATGGSRTDHMLFSLMMILRIAHSNQAIDFQVHSGKDVLIPILPEKRHIIDAEQGTILSIVAFSDLKRLTVSGVRWPLKEQDIDFGSTRTLSNVVVSDTLIHLGDGHAIAIMQTGA